MNGELAQLACLATYGSAWLARAERPDPPALERENSTFRFVGSLRFELRNGSPAHESGADTVADWLRQLRDRETDRLWLFIPEAKSAAELGRPADERMLAGFANAGWWSLIATGGRRSEVWRASWTVGDRNAPDQRIWSVRYEGMWADPWTPASPDVHSATAALTSALEDAHGFAARQGFDGWAALFERALVGADIPDQPDMMAPTCTREARHLATMADQAWVFGGMGSWNDIYVDQAAAAEYDTVSNNLYNAILSALVAGVNDGPSRLAR